MNHLSLLFSTSIAESEPIKLLDGDLTLYKRPNSQQWQCRFKLATGAWHSASTGSDQLAEATTQAISIYETVKVKIASDLAVKTRTFRQLANQELALAARVVQVRTGRMAYIRYRSHSLQLPFTLTIFSHKRHHGLALSIRLVKSDLL
jgi:hypothetical protein